MKVFLTGFPGSGKTYLGSQAAVLLSYPFVDTDKLVEKEDDSSVQIIFREKGENYFREKEAKILRDLSGKRNVLIAAGGGLPCFHENMRFMNEAGLTVYLEASAAFLFHRLVKEKKTRPLISHLSDIELMIYITETLAARRKFYELAQLKVNAETCTPAKLASAIKKWIE
jgi:shikimate kinase